MGIWTHLLSRDFAVVASAGQVVAELGTFSQPGADGGTSGGQEEVGLGPVWNWSHHQYCSCLRCTTNPGTVFHLGSQPVAFLEATSCQVMWLTAVNMCFQVMVVGDCRPTGGCRMAEDYRRTESSLGNKMLDCLLGLSVAMPWETGHLVSNHNHNHHLEKNQMIFRFEIFKWKCNEPNKIKVQPQNGKGLGSLQHNLNRRKQNQLIDKFKSRTFDSYPIISCWLRSY